MAKEMNHEALQANLRMMEKQGQMALEAAKKQDPAMAEKMEKIIALCKDDVFLNAFGATKSAEEAVTLFAENGVEVTAEEVTEFVKIIRSFVEKLVENGGELSEAELEQIAGGAGAEKIIEQIGKVAGAAFAVIGDFFDATFTKVKNFFVSLFSWW